ncbi:hypothetical protein HDU97_008199 [Phlyctochytrium planicorne]|nr:hypothetical protein HDU97_008199 [Phlyctochytrium planicorne]
MSIAALPTYVWTTSNAASTAAGTAGQISTDSDFSTAAAQIASQTSTSSVVSSVGASLSASTSITTTFVPAPPTYVWTGTSWTWSQILESVTTSAGQIFSSSATSVEQIPTSTQVAQTSQPSTSSGQVSSSAFAEPVATSTVNEFAGSTTSSGVGEKATTTTTSYVTTTEATKEDETETEDISTSEIYEPTSTSDEILGNAPEATTTANPTGNDDDSRNGDDETFTSDVFETATSGASGTYATQTDYLADPKATSTTSPVVAEQSVETTVAAQTTAAVGTLETATAATEQTSIAEVASTTVIGTTTLFYVGDVTTQGESSSTSNEATISSEGIAETSQQIASTTYIVPTPSAETTSTTENAYVEPIATSIATASPEIVSTVYSAPASTVSPSQAETTSFEAAQQTTSAASPAAEVTSSSSSQEAAEQITSTTSPVADVTSSSSSEEAYVAPQATALPSPSQTSEESVVTPTATEYRTTTTPPPLSFSSSVEQINAASSAGDEFSSTYAYTPTKVEESVAPVASALPVVSSTGNVGVTSTQAEVVETSSVSNQETESKASSTAAFVGYQTTAPEVEVSSSQAGITPTATIPLANEVASTTSYVIPAPPEPSTFVPSSSWWTSSSIQISESSEQPSIAPSPAPKPETTTDVVEVAVTSTVSSSTVSTVAPAAEITSDAGVVTSDISEAVGTTTISPIAEVTSVYTEPILGGGRTEGVETLVMTDVVIQEPEVTWTTDAVETVGEGYVSATAEATSSGLYEPAQPTLYAPTADYTSTSPASPPPEITLPVTESSSTTAQNSTTTTTTTVPLTTTYLTTTTANSTTFHTTSTPPPPEPEPQTTLPPPATIGLSVAGGVLAVGGAAALAFLYKSGSIGTSMVRMTAASDPMLQMARGNPLYESPGGVHENPLYQPDHGGGVEGVV